MAMNKKETAEVERLKRELRLKGALRSTEPVSPDVPIPSCRDGNSLSVGFLPVGEQGDWPRIEPACSSTVHHGIGRTDRTSTQGARNLYSTRLKALRALRYDVEQCCCTRLAKVDEMIEQEMAKAPQ